MKVPPRIHQNLEAFWRWLTEPPPTVEDPLRRLKAQFLAGLLAVLIPVGLVFTALPLLVLPEAQWLTDTDLAFVVPIFLLFIIAYVWARQGAYERSVLFLSAAGSVVVFIIAVQDGDLEDLTYLVFVAFLTSMFLPTRRLLLLLIGIGVLLALAPGMSPVSVNVLEYTTSIVPFVVVGIVLIVMLNAYRDRLETLRQELLRQREQQYRELFEMLFEGMVVVREGVIQDVTESFAALVGWRREALIGRRLSTLFTPDSQQVIRAILDGMEQPREVKAVDADGDVVHLEVVGKAFRFDTQPLHIFAFRDITDRKQMEQELHYRAHHDALTGLPNRVALLARLQYLLDQHARSNGKHFALLFIDLDRFKLINDSLGHAVGDQVLREVAARLQQARREDDVVARLGGDEFVLLLSDVQSPHDAELVADRLLETLRQPIHVDHHELYVDASIGIAMGAGTYTDASALLQDADIAMYHAKSEGRGTYRFFRTAMREQIQRTHAQKMALQRAVQLRQFVPFYQPIFDLQRECVVGIEVFARWLHPEHGVVAPSEFLPLLEEMGLLHVVNLQVYEQAFQDFCEWKDAQMFDNDLWLHLNVDALQLMQPEFVKEIRALLDAHTLAPADIAIQVHEPVLLSRSVMVEKTIQALQAEGMRLVIDDFGTGYSSLTLLHHVKPAAVMLDRSLMQWLEQPEYVRILRGLVNLMHDMRVTIGIEGVETKEQMQRVRALAFEWGQGYALARPMPGRLVKTWWNMPPLNTN